MSNQTVGPFESDEIDEYIKYNREYRFVTNKMYIVCIYIRTTSSFYFGIILNAFGNKGAFDIIVRAPQGVDILDF